MNWKVKTKVFSVEQTEDIVESVFIQHGEAGL